MQTQLQWKLRIRAEQRPESLAGYPRLEDWLQTADLTPQLIQVCVFVCVYLVDLFSRLCFWVNQKNANHPIKALQVGLKNVDILLFQKRLVKGPWNSAAYFLRNMSTAWFRICHGWTLMWHWRIKRNEVGIWSAFQAMSSSLPSSVHKLQCIMFLKNKNVKL